jgi:hypothetical protein
MASNEGHVYASDCGLFWKTVNVMEPRIKKSRAPLARQNLLPQFWQFHAIFSEID